ncbi:MAG: LOG family protein [Bacilli bacterium]|nr:LOG family protein [Bacilli bacterium]
MNDDVRENFNAYKSANDTNKLNIFIASSSREEIKPIYLDCASSISRTLANLGYNLSFGAGTVGMMGKCYEEFNKVSAEIYSYTIEKYQDDLKDLNSTKEVVLDTTFDRTKELYDRADIILFLPGGTGTLSELFSILEENRSVLKPKKIILYNYNDFYNKILDFINYLISERFNDDTIYNYFDICNTEVEVITLLNEENNKLLIKK